MAQNACSRDRGEISPRRAQADGQRRRIQHEPTAYHRAGTIESSWIGKWSQRHSSMSCLVITLINQTNIRSALWWGDALRQGIEIGTRGYDFAIHSLYSPRGHPASVMWAAMGGRLSITDNLGLCRSNLFDHDKVNEIVNSQWVRKEDDPERYQDSDDELDSTPNRLIFDPAFLAEIEPAKSKGLFDRFK